MAAQLIRIRGLTEEENAVALIIHKQPHNTFEDFEEARSHTRENMQRRLAGFQNVPETKLEELIPMVPLVYQIAEELALNAYTFGRAMRYRWCTKDADVALIFAKCCEMITSLPSYAERVQELVVANDVVRWLDVCATSVLLVFARGMATEVGNIVRKNELFPDMNQLFPKREKGRTLDIADLVGYGRLWPSDHDLYEMQERLKVERVKFLQTHGLLVRDGKKPTPEVNTGELTELQRRILEELTDRAYTAEELTAHLNNVSVKCDVSTVKRALKELKKKHLVSNKRGSGYYRPNRPPKPVTD